MEKSSIGKSPAFQFYAADFAMDTQSWSAEEVGVYVRLLCSEWVNGSIPPMPATDGTAMSLPMANAKRALNRLARIAGISEEQLLKVWPQVGEKFFRGEDGNLYNSRLEYERQKQIAYRNEKSKAGTAGAEKRWNPARNNGQTDSTANGTAIVLPMANGMTNDSSSSSSSFSSSKKEKNSASRAAKTGSRHDAENREAVKRHAEENANADRLWAEIGSTPDGAELLGNFGPRFEIQGGS
jgi:uncharacterized protein YdaU (DUF1376 family)